MQMVTRTLSMQGRGRRFTGGASDGSGTMKLTLRRAGAGYKFVVQMKGADMAQLDTTNRNLTVAIETGGTQFVGSRALVAKKNVLKLPKKRRGGRR